MVKTAVTGSSRAGHPPASPARFLPAIVALATGVPLFGPQALVGRLGLANVVNRFRTTLGIACLLAVVVLLVAQVMPWAFRVVTRNVGEWWRQRKGKTRLHELTRSEKNLLKQYISRETRTLVLDPSSSATSALLLAGIIDRAVELDDKALGLAFNIQAWAWAYLKNNRHLLETSEVSSARLRTSAQPPSAVPDPGRATGPLG